jgi:hypothetical protein
VRELEAWWAADRPAARTTFKEAFSAVIGHLDASPDDTMLGQRDRSSTTPRRVYFVPSLGARFYPRGSHGAMVDLDYRLDSDTDAVCISFFDPCPDNFQIDFAVVHAGYAYRHIVESPKSPYRRAWGSHLT